MASTFIWCEDNGGTVGNPATRSGFSTGTTAPITTVDSNGHATTSPANCNWKAADDCNQYGTDGNGAGASAGTPYSSSPITAGANSYTKHQYGKFVGSFNQISSGLWAHTAGVFGTGITLKGAVTSTYAAPATTANGALTTDMTAVTAIGSGTAVLFSTTGPNGTTSSTLGTTAAGTVGGFTQYLATQLQTTASAAAGDTTQVTLTFQYNEN